MLSHVSGNLHNVGKARYQFKKKLAHLIYKDKQIMRQQQLAKQPINYSVDHPETCEYEQKPIIRLDEFTDEEEREIKEKNRKRRAASKKENSEGEQVKKAKNERKLN